MEKHTANEVINQLLNLISSGELKPGERIPSEHVLASTLCVSRNTLRAALNKLNTLGIIETRRGSGSYVKNIGSEFYLDMLLPLLLSERSNLQDIIEFRRGIEPRAAYLAAIRATREDKITLQALGTKISKCDASDVGMQSRLNTDLHNNIVAASKSRLLLTMTELIHTLISDELKLYVVRMGTEISSDYYHKMIVQAIIESRPDDAAYLMDKHISEVNTVYMNLLNTQAQE